jgi:hypothetical protein
MFVINPEKYSTPAYRIGPFCTSDVSFNHTLPVDSGIDDYFNKRFQGRKFYYFLNGRSAINRAIQFYHLKKSDVVSILTTTGNDYIAKCVTDEIEKICQWSRQIEENSKLILVNHEFGYPYKELESLKKYGLPIIEDCAGAFFSVDENNTIGNVGDFAVYSFPKMFPIQIGGLLLSNQPIALENNFLDGPTRQYINNVLSHYIKVKDAIIQKRISNYKKIRSSLEEMGLQERFELKKGIVPGVYMFRKYSQDIDMPGLKEYMWSHGIQCSILYQEASFFIPCHHRLDENDILYFKEVIKSFFDK